MGRANSRRVVAGLVAAALVVPAALAFAHGGDESSSASSQELAMLTTASGQSVPKESKIDFCPTEEQSDLHWRTYGFDYKPTIPCGDAVNMETPASDEIPEQPPLELPSNFGEAQALFDPDDDPQLLVGKDPATGDYTAVLVSTRDPIPSRIRSLNRFKKWSGNSDGLMDAP